ncbi:MAG: type II toxin-antitoxin system prevent-host-death family antitoxin [Candidatus Nanopelagicales bacterium]
MYILYMATEMPVTEARERFSEVVETSASEPVFLTKRGQREAVVISTLEYDRLLQAQEDAEDLAAADEAMAEIIAGAPTIPWLEVKEDLGIG